MCHLTGETWGSPVVIDKLKNRGLRMENNSCKATSRWLEFSGPLVQRWTMSLGSDPAHSLVSSVEFNGDIHPPAPCGSFGARTGESDIHCRDSMAHRAKVPMRGADSWCLSCSTPLVLFWGGHLLIFKILTYIYIQSQNSHTHNFSFRF